MDQTILTLLVIIGGFIAVTLMTQLLNRKSTE